MELLIMSIPIVFLVGLATGYFIGRNKNKTTTEVKIKKIDAKKRLKVIHKSEPKTYQQRRQEALDKGKPIIKVFKK